MNNDLNKRNQAVGAFCAISLVSLLLIFWPPKVPSAQALATKPVPEPVQPLAAVVDSLVQDNDRRDSFNLTLARDVIKKAEKKLQEQGDKQRGKRKKPQKIAAYPGIVLFTTDSMVYEVPASYYDGIAIIDPQDLPAELMIIAPVRPAETMAPDRPGLLKRIGNFFTKPLKKHDQ